MVTMGISLESTGLILPLLGLCLDTYYRPWKISGEHKVTPFSGLRLHFWSFGIAGIFLLIRHFLGIKPYVINLPITEKFLTLARTIFNTFFHGFSEFFMFAAKGISLFSVILGLFIVLVSAWYVKQGPDRRRFITLLLLWVGACLPHTIGANFESRYLYFPGVFAALVLGDLLGTLRLRLQGRKSAWLCISLVIIGYSCADFYAFHRALNYYLEATRIYDAGIQKIKSSLPEMPAGTRLVLVDFPDYINRPRTIHQGQQGRYHILVYHNALPAHLHLLYQNLHFTITFLKLLHPNNNDPYPLGTPSSQEQLANLLAAPKTVVLRYSPGNPGNFVIIREP